MQPSFLLFLVLVFSQNGSDASYNRDESAQSWDSEKPSWTPDGKSIVFSSNRDGNKEIYIMNSDGSHIRNLTNSPNPEMFPSVSPDGSKIAFVSEVDGNYDIYLMNSDGSGNKRLTDHEKIDDWPSWIEDGKKIIFDSERGGTWGIYSMNADGSSQEVVVDTSDKEVDPGTSPFTQQVVYSRQQGDVRQIYSYSFSNGDVSNLSKNNITGNGVLTSTSPSISPSGNEVVFQSGEEYWDIYVMDIDGTNLVRLTNNNYDDHWPAWSPDGRKIAFTSNRDGPREIYTMSHKGENINRLTFGVDDK